MIVYEHKYGNTMDHSADLAIKLAKDLRHTVQLQDGVIRVTVHTFDNPETIVERWKSELKASQRPKCDTCPHWNKQPDSKFGQCHRFPPRIVNPGNLTGIYSETTANYWCGEHPLMPAWHEKQTRERGPDPDIAPSPNEPTIAVHEETIRTQSKLIASLRESIADVRRANGDLQERADRTNKANVGLLNQLIDIHEAVDRILRGVPFGEGSVRVTDSTMRHLRDVRSQQQAVRVHPESTEVDHA